MVDVFHVGDSIYFRSYCHLPLHVWTEACQCLQLSDAQRSALLNFFCAYSISLSYLFFSLGSAIIFVAIMKHFFLRTPLEKFKWVGVFWNVVSVVVVGWAAMLTDAPASPEGAASVTDPGHFVPNPFVGIMLILSGAFVQSLQYCFEEKVMSSAEQDDMPPIPPLLLIGMEGFWGTVICVTIIYPLAYAIPGPDHGSFENPYNTWTMFVNSPSIQNVFIVYFFSILMYNMLAVLVTFMLDSVWHAILDNFRPITVWGADLFIFYFITVTLGEQWTNWSFLQFFGMLVLLYGTAIYNAPNPGSILLDGGWSSFFIDCTNEYKRIEEEEYPENRSLIVSTPKTPRQMPYYDGFKPLMSPVATDREKERRIQNRLEMGEVSRDPKYGSILNRHAEQ